MIPRVIWTTRAVYYLAGFSGSFLIPYLSLWWVHDGYGITQIGVILGVSAAFGIMIQPLWGVASDRKPTSRLPLLLVMAAPGLMAIGFNVRSFPALLALAVGFNVFAVSRGSLTDAYAVTLSRPASRASYGSLRLFGSIGSAMGAYLGGVYIARVSVHTLWLPFLLLSLLAGVLVRLLPLRSSHAVPPEFWANLKHTALNRRFLLFLLGGFLVQQTLTAYDQFFSLAFQQIGGAFADTGLAFALGSLSNVPFMLLGARFLSRREPVLVMLVAALTYTVRWALMALFPLPWVFIAVQALHGMSFGLFWIAGVQYVARIFPGHLRTSGQSVFGMVVVGLASIAGNLADGLALKIGGPVLLYSSAAGSSALGAACLAALFCMGRAGDRTAVAQPLS